MVAEAEAITAAAERVGEGFSRAVRILAGHTGKVIVTGLGKSGLVAQKLAATLCSTGTPAVFLHPVDALHGDVGIYSGSDPTVMLSKSGTTIELLRLVPVLRELRSPLIGIIGNPTSPLARQMDEVLDAFVRMEADPHNLAPTSSTAVATALGDALALAVMQAREQTAEDFSRRHPAGQLGRNLRVTVREVMHSGEKVAWTEAGHSVKAVILAMNQRPLGAACVIGAEGELAGIFTDGDLRRALQNHDDIRTVCVADVMTIGPVTIHPDASLKDALRIMEDRPSQISVLPVVEAGKCLGLVRLHDLYQPELA